MIKAVVFDFDGTLCDTNEVIINSFNAIYNKYYHRDADRAYVLSTFGEPLATTVERDFADFPVEEVLSHYRSYQLERFDRDVMLYDTVYDTLKALHEKGIKMAVVTARLRQSTENALAMFNVEKYFELLVCADDHLKHKPDPEPLLYAIDKLGFKLEEVLYVGDSKFDMECAISAKVTPVLVGWQEGSDDLRVKYGVRYVLSSMKDLLILTDEQVMVEWKKV